MEDTGVETISWVQTSKQLGVVAAGSGALTVVGLLLFVSGNTVVGAVCLAFFGPATLFLAYRLVSGRRETLTIADTWVEDTSIRTGPIAFDDIDGFRYLSMNNNAHFLCLDMNDDIARSYLPSSKVLRLVVRGNRLVGGSTLNLNVGHFEVGPEVIAVELDRRISAYKEVN